jgi:hypothetical protein
MFCRNQPSPRYKELITQYVTMHREGEGFLKIPAALTFPGQNLLPHAAKIKDLIDSTGSLSLLDYGSGKGLQYEPAVKANSLFGQGETVMDYWGIDCVTCYDPCYVPYSTLPIGKFDGVVSTDVLEHCPIEDMEWIVGEIFNYSCKFVFANVACYPAKKRLPNGENAHTTIMPAQWWSDLVRRVAGRHPHIKWEFLIEERLSEPHGVSAKVTRLASAQSS